MTVLLSIQKRVRIVAVVLEADSGGMFLIIVHIGQAWCFVASGCRIKHRLALDRVEKRLVSAASLHLNDFKIVDLLLLRLASSVQTLLL